MNYLEPHLKDRMDEALRLAKRAAEDIVETEAELELRFKIAISDHYNIPLFSDYFQDRILDELAFEAYFIEERRTKGSQTVADMAVGNIEAAAAEVMKQFDEFEMTEISEVEKAQMLKFMESNAFPGEPK